MGDPVVRWQIISPQPDEVVRFYSTAFGWIEHRDNALGYRELRANHGHGLPGGLWPAPAGAPSFVQLFIEVQDVAATIDKVQSLGGTVLVPRSVLPDGEVMAVVRDPLGMSIELVTPRPSPSS